MSIYKFCILLKFIILPFLAAFNNNIHLIQNGLKQLKLFYSNLDIGNELFNNNYNEQEKIHEVNLKYCEDLNFLKRFPSRTMKVGKVKIGSKHPVVCQTMLNSDTRDIKSTLNQILRVEEAGAELVRITVQGIKEVEACHKLKEEMNKINCDIPIVADIHFNPKIALLSAEIFDKIRINPGNYVDGRKKFIEKSFDIKSFEIGKEKIIEQFTPLVIKCKKLGRALRIGTNHGSLSSRIMNFYGDTPIGMIKSAFEFAEICRENDFHNFCFSMKSSNPFLMIKAYRLLVSQMYMKNYDYPIHLGVTEAGEGEDGRIKSAIGIGSLLLDGIGDTIRVSLTEDPWFEISPCKKLINFVKNSRISKEKSNLTSQYFNSTRDFLNISKRNLHQLNSSNKSDILNNFLHRDGSVISAISSEELEYPDTLYQNLGCQTTLGIPFKDLSTSDSIFLNSIPDKTYIKSHLTLKRLQKSGIGIMALYKELLHNPLENSMALICVKDILNISNQNVSNIKNSTYISLPPKASCFGLIINSDEKEEEIKAAFELLYPSPQLILLNIPNEKDHLQTSRQIFDFLSKCNITIPVIHQLIFPKEFQNLEDLQIMSGIKIGNLLIDKLGEGIFLQGTLDLSLLRKLSFALLQGSRMRTVKTEFISCPSCGRTLFDLQQVTKMIKSKTGHLPGVTIAVMGCIVNGVGEMADADFGYVGGSPGKVDLYVGKKLVERGIPNEDACNNLIELIKKHNRWVDP